MSTPAPNTLASVDVVLDFAAATAATAIPSQAAHLPPEWSLSISVPTGFAVVTVVTPAASTTVLSFSQQLASESNDEEMGIRKENTPTAIFQLADTEIIRVAYAGGGG